MMTAVSTAYAWLCLAGGGAMVVEATRRRSARSLLGQRGCGAFMLAAGTATYGAVAFESRHAINDAALASLATIVFLGIGTFYRRLSRRVGGTDQPGWPLEAKLAGPLLFIIVLAGVGGDGWRGVTAAASMLGFGEYYQWLQWLIADRSGRRP